MVDAPFAFAGERGNLTIYTPPAASKIDMPVGVEDDSLGFEHCALQARMLAIGRDATGHTRRFYARLERMSPDNLQRVR
jgi:hypothetical protein